MKSILLTLSLILISTLSLAQSVEIYKEGYTTDISGTTVSGSGDSFEMKYYMDFKNTSGSTQTFTLERKKMEVVAGVGDYLCWGASLVEGACYPEEIVTPEDPFITPLEVTLENDSMGIIWSYHIPNNVSGNNTYRYYVVANGAPVDSVDVNYSYTLSVQSQKPATVNVFPNPANHVLNVNIEHMSSNSSISIYDITGKVVLNSPIINGNNQLNVEDLNAGVYFYAIRNNKDIIETKKLLIL